jgi:predicted 2-oxoglutarate/Fe(II)-dependent dioxygenase YbiX
MRLFSARDFLNAELCYQIRNAIDAGEVEPAEVLTESGAMSHSEDVRRATSVEVDEATLAFVEVTLEESKEALSSFFGLELDSREGPGFLCYRQDGFYKPHRDRAASDAWPDAARRQLTIVLFLNDDFRGGDLRLLPDEEEPLVVHPSTGTLIAFDAGIAHEVLPVAVGRRYSIVDWWL